jgi:hypothetical protein
MPPAGGKRRTFRSRTFAACLREGPHGVAGRGPRPASPSEARRGRSRGKRAGSQKAFQPVKAFLMQTGEGQQRENFSVHTFAVFEQDVVEIIHGVAQYPDRLRQRLVAFG